MIKKITLILLIPILFVVPSVFAQESAVNRSILLTIYIDGVVEVEHSVSVDPTYPTANVSLFGQVVEDVLVVDENWLPLNYFITDGIISINTLGARTARIFYLTSDLTDKDGRYWSLNISVPLNVRITLSKDASIISLNVVPESIQSSNGKTILIMPGGEVEVTYVIGIVGTKEHADLLISEAEQKIQQIKNLGVNVSEAELLLSQAKDAFATGNYASAEEMAGKAKDLAVQLNGLFDQATVLIFEAEKAIADAEDDGRTSGLEEAKNLLEQSKGEFSIGNYQQEIDLASQAKTKAQNIPSNYSDSILYLGILLLLIIITLISLFLYKVFYSAKRVPYEKEKLRVKLDMILEKNLDLRPEDREALEFLKDAGGEAYEAEIRVRFKLPRTSTWRLIKRLERKEIIEVRKAGGQNLIKVRKEYCD
jgi:uncharacterized membrane protein